MEGLKTNPKKRVRIRINCPICKHEVLKKDLKRHQQGPWCYSQTYKKKTKIPVILGPDFGREQLENRRLIEQSRENRVEDKRDNDMGIVSHLGYHDGSITITGGREIVICPICKHESLKHHLPRHQLSKLCLMVRAYQDLSKQSLSSLYDLFKEKETICS